MGGDAMYYGLNALSNNMILLDRKQSRCPNGLVFGTPGSGKSMSCKREITFIMLMTQDNVIICDPEEPPGHQPQLLRGRKPAGAEK